MRRIAAREDPITIWGSGRQIRDFIHIDDIVEGVMSTYAGAVPGDVMNLGTGRKTTFKSLVEMAAAQVGYSPEIRVDLTRPEGVFARYSDEPRTEITVELPAGIRRMLKHLDKTLQPV
jgi:GDP-L-fucose synthase